MRGIFKKRSIRAGLALTGSVACAASSALLGAGVANAADVKTKTPIEHVVVIFSENISFDHYFGTYPKAANIDGEKLQGSDTPAPKFDAKPDTPKVNTLAQADLLGDKNPNSVKPFRLTPGQAATPDQSHEYAAEQEAMNGGKMDKFPETVSTDKDKKDDKLFSAPGMTMGYYDGNTVTGLWNYAQNFAMSDNSYSTTFGPSTPGALNLVAGSITGHVYKPTDASQQQIKPGQDSSFAGVSDDGKTASIVGDPDPLYDDCSNSSSSGTMDVAALDSKNIGDQLNDKGVTWGWFQGGFRPTEKASDSARARCGEAHKTMTGSNRADYNPHHEPFQYFASTANPHHVAPSSDDKIGQSDQANHQYDMKDFDTALSKGNLPAVSFLKADNYQDGHAGYSNPLDEQAFISHQINALQNSKDWDKTAVIIAYDDSDGWYDHAAPKVLNGSKDSSIDPETKKPVDSEICTAAADKNGVKGNQNGQCGPGTRQPLLVVSPFAKQNFVDNTYTEQTSITKFIQDNWGLGRLGGNAFDDRAGELNNMFDFNGKKADKLFLNETDGTKAASFDAVKKVDNSSRAVQAQLKPVAAGMDPKATEPKDADKAKNASNKAEDKKDHKNNIGWWILGILVALAVIGGIIGATKGKKGNKKPAEANKKNDGATPASTTGAATDKNLNAEKHEGSTRFGDGENKKK